MKQIILNIALLCCFMTCLFIFPNQTFAYDSGSNQVLVEASKKRWNRAFSLASKKSDPLLKKTVEWIYLTESEQVDRSFDQIKYFLDTSQGWPSLKGIRLQAEKKLPKDWTYIQAIEWFEKYPPVTLDAVIAYTDALKKQGQSQKAIIFIKEYWTNNRLSSNGQEKFLSKFKTVLNQYDHQARLDFLLWEKEFTLVSKMMNLVDKEYKTLARARMLLSRNRSGVNQAIAAVPSKYKTDEGLQYERLKWRRKKGLNKGAIEILDNAPKHLLQPKKWWQERHIIIRRALEDKDYRLAYHLAKNHRQKEGFSHAQAEWISGWLALSFLKKPYEAFQHFHAMYKKVGSPISKSRGAYWAGLASLALGDESVAKQWLAEAARYSTTFYGQLANTKLKEIDPLYQVVSLQPIPSPNQIQTARFNNKELVKVTKLLGQAGLIDERETFFWQLISNVQNPVEYVLIANMAERYGDYASSVRSAKKALNKGYIMLEAGYPVLKNTNTPLYLNGVEAPLVYSLIRQESAFKINARSHAGALGLMQLMPGTARDTARKQGVSYRKDRLTQDPAYNIRLGSSYIGQMINRYDGYYILAIAAYNAGPARVDRILKEIGDPRKGKINIIDWIEMIPIYETRNYVQRVLEGLHVYRLRLQNNSLKTQTMTSQR